MDIYDKADTYHHLGVVAQALGEYEKPSDFINNPLISRWSLTTATSKPKPITSYGRVAEKLQEYDKQG